MFHFMSNDSVAFRKKQILYGTLPKFIDTYIHENNSKVLFIIELIIHYEQNLIYRSLHDP